MIREAGIYCRGYAEPLLFQNLDVYKLSLQLAIDLHKATLRFPKGTGYELGDQIRRAASSIPSNIAEGAMRNSPKEFIQYVAIARGSCAELHTQLAIAQGVGILEAVEFQAKVERVGQMLTALLKSLRSRSESR